MRIIVSIVFLITLSSCSKKMSNSNLDLDHISIWTKNPTNAKEKLIELGFTAIPDSLCQIHHGQGTSGRFFYFLNTYLELIFINDSTEFYNNIQKNKELDFLERSMNSSTGYAPFGLALKMKNYTKDEIPFDVIEYNQSWMKDGNNIYSAKNSKLNKNEPSIFVVYPEIEYDKFENIEDLSKIPEEYSIWRQFYKHKNGVQKVSKINIYSSSKINLNSKSLNAIHELEIIELFQGAESLMEIYFDNGGQDQRIDLRPEIPIILNW